MISDGQSESYQAHSSSSRDDPWPLPTLTPSSSHTFNFSDSPHRRQSYARPDLPNTDLSHTVPSRSASVSSPHHPRSRKGSSVVPVSAHRDALDPIPDDSEARHHDQEPSAHARPRAPVTRSNSELPAERDVKQNDQPQSAPRRESLKVGHSYYWPRWSQSNYGNTDTKVALQAPKSSSMESYNIAIIGATGVGKSSFVQRVLNLSRPPITNASSMRVAVDNATHLVTLLELDLEYFELNPSQPIQWPRQINGHIVPRVDAALLLYDVMNQESIRELPQAAGALANSNLPAILVACKCEHPIEEWVVDADGMTNHPFFKSCFASYKLMSNETETSRLCLQTIVGAAVAHRKEESIDTSLRRRAQSAANLDSLDASNARPASEHSKHSRASSDLSLLRGFPNAPLMEKRRAQTSRGLRSGQQFDASSLTPTSESGEPGQQSYNSMLRTSGIRVDRPGSDVMLEVEESDAESHRYSDDIPILQRSDEGANSQQAKSAGVPFDDLVDRLLAPRLTRADNNFSDIFLCLYRKFAAPGQLFLAILKRLDRVREDKAAHYLSKTATQLRIIEVVAKWVSLYPGDFARPTTRRNLEDFIRHLSTEPIFSIAAQQMRRNLHLNVVEDDDTGWANADDLGDKVASELLHKDLNDLADGVGIVQLDDVDDGRPSGSSDTSMLDRGGSIGSQFQFHSFDEYDREAALLEPTDHLPMNKFRYHIFMDIPDDDIADELTRIDWIMFSSIRIRDFVRHVSLPSTQKGKCKSLRNVNRMISHFNHIAKWVANMILLRDKAKHRAQIMEKFMNIALKLRQLNNYNGLAAVLAGINGTAIHRLAQTRALVPHEAQKRFARLVILMGTQKSHFAYRLAWENSPLPRIPFIPLHRRDLVSAEEGSKTFVGAHGDRINWKKFEVLGEVLLPIMRSQGTAYPNLAKHEVARELVLGCRMPTDEEEIYQRSIQVESSSSGPVDPTKKKFPWFAK
ncbi:Ras guanine nucleotide exchange factor A [Paramyrothecium foliicola]|nr:Ras guanine nucleotide exchange factor A [Paramyrothecium foliicola]